MLNAWLIYLKFLNFTVIVSAAAIRQPYFKYFIADHPVIYYIHDKINGAILFIGRIQSLPDSQ